ncbi:hypothetical protein FF38_06563 [Lucilia cuprina]|uniref:Uncharacterized protein n=1 Tax=Lucilia cuprina TaxID=7375 RepID=A0A0L0CB23_LUCCU|nr:hypothetical protein FF38_06563 [Lucilia cuprina]
MYMQFWSCCKANNRQYLCVYLWIWSTSTCLPTLVGGGGGDCKVGPSAFAYIVVLLGFSFIKKGLLMFFNAHLYAILFEYKLICKFFCRLIPSSLAFIGWLVGCLLVSLDGWSISCLPGLDFCSLRFSCIGSSSSSSAVSSVYLFLHQLSSSYASQSDIVKYTF